MERKITSAVNIQNNLKLSDVSMSKNRMGIHNIIIYSREDITDIGIYL